VKIIIQAGGRGTRLGKYTVNKPKALLSIDNKPMIFHLFDIFKGSEFIVIADYKKDIFCEYLNCFAANINYKFVFASEKGTASGVKESLQYIQDDEPFVITWCDLVFDDISIPDDLTRNYVGLSENFMCRWSYENSLFKHLPAEYNGVAGFFIFKDKKVIEDVPLNGAFVKWLSTNENINFEKFYLKNAQEFGTKTEYEKFEKRKFKCRPFNKMEIDLENNCLSKISIGALGKQLNKNEIEWYKAVAGTDVNIPKIKSYTPLTMEYIDGVQGYEKNFSLDRKLCLINLIEAVKKLHSQFPVKTASVECQYINYFKKTFDRIDTIDNLVPFAKQKSIFINGVECPNPFFHKQAILDLTKKYYSDKFHLIHGDITFHNCIFDYDCKVYMIDPRGYFGKTKIYGDADYDWAKIYYSLVGNYDKFNRLDFDLTILEDEVILDIASNGWEYLVDYYFSLIGAHLKEKVKFLHMLIWLSLTTYAWNDYDSICAAFYNGCYYLKDYIDV
jgi:GTP:adenosylcobinamide-phosphate guanylyltransferase